MTGPNPDNPYPLPDHKRVGFLKAFVNQPNIEVGDFSYYDDPRGPEGFVERCVLHHYDFIGDRLIIGKFCAIATGVTFIMNGANHAMMGFSTFPFNIFGHGWDTGFDFATIRAGFKGDTMIGNDVWIGHEATIMPGVTVGDGAVIGAKSVVGADIPAYCIVAGNPARVLRLRFDQAIVNELLRICWWNWSIDKITRHLDAIRGADIEALKNAA